MTGSASVECAAVRLAAHLARAHGDAALDRAVERRRDAIRRRDGLNADLYLAVCIVLEDRFAVFSLSRIAAARL